MPRPPITDDKHHQGWLPNRTDGPSLIVNTEEPTGHTMAWWPYTPAKGKRPWFFRRMVTVMINNADGALHFVCEDNVSSPGDVTCRDHLLAQKERTNRRGG